MVFSVFFLCVSLSVLLCHSPFVSFSLIIGTKQGVSAITAASGRGVWRDCREQFTSAAIWRNKFPLSPSSLFVHLTNWPLPLFYIVLSYRMLIMSHSSSLNVGEAGGKFKVRRMFGEPTNYRFHAITTEPYTIARICTDAIEICRYYRHVSRRVTKK